MTRTMRRSGLVIVALLAALALTGLIAGCGDDGETTTTTAAPDTTTTTSGLSTDTTIVEGGKTLDAYREEIPGLEAAIAADPTDLYSLEMLAVANYNLGQYEPAEAAYKKILAITDDAFTHNNLGNVYRDWGKPDLAIAEYEAAIKLDPTLKHPYVNLAGIYKTQGDLQKAMDVLKSGVKYMTGDDAQVLEQYQSDITSTTTT